MPTPPVKGRKKPPRSTRPLRERVKLWDKTQALREEGKTYSEISKKLKVPESSL